MLSMGARNHTGTDRGGKDLAQALGVRVARGGSSGAQSLQEEQAMQPWKQLGAVVIGAWTAIPAVAAGPPVAVFAELDGTWQGTFVGWDAEGRELFRLRVAQTYRTVSDTTQEVAIEDLGADGTVTTGRGENVATRAADGTLALTCKVEKSNGDTVLHQGSVVTGPGGRPEILWHSQGAGRAEVFRERVVEEGGETLYLIDGLGRYGDGVVLMAGRYRRVAGPRGEH
jgi:hypothetical protein